MLAIGIALTVMLALGVVAISIGKITAAKKLKSEDVAPVNTSATFTSSSAAGAESAAAKPDVTPGVIYAASFTDVDGKPQSLGQWQKKLLVINFWATWCAPCKEEMPIFAKLQRRMEAKGIQFVGIAADSRANVVNFAQKSPVGYPLYPSESGAIDFSKRLGNRLGLLPHTVVVAPGGDVVYTKLGQILEADFAAILEKNLPKELK
jgi:thiol-disulfide isomerase/thioredoxin